MTRAGASLSVELQPGVRFECFVGGPQKARDLTTGLVTFDAGAELPYHTHTFSESITVLEGRAEFEVEGRCYSLGPLDNLVVPRKTAHLARNAAADDPAVLHIAMPSHQPTRTLVDRRFDRQMMPASATGLPGAERFNRFGTAPSSEAGPRADLTDFFNADLMPGLEMSGGHGLFHPGGRLPAHVHDFDESICIIRGQATCVVEGRRYPLSECATALVPRGRVHYFINETQAPMAMLWVYAGPLPRRLVVDERCATAEGNPWR
jgi:quercetin dioxygenase-like cupin family protein